MMKEYKLENDLKLFCVTAPSFPEGIEEAFQTLEKKLPTNEGRTFYGIFFMNKEGKMIYKACVLETFEGEGDRYECETFIIKKGEYLTEKVSNWKENIAMINKTFGKLRDARKDTALPGVEWYQGDDVICMLRLDNGVNT